MYVRNNRWYAALINTVDIIIRSNNKITNYPKQIAMHKSAYPCPLVWLSNKPERVKHQRHSEEMLQTQQVRPPRIDKHVFCESEDINIKQKLAKKVNRPQSDWNQGPAKHRSKPKPISCQNSKACNNHGVIAEPEHILPATKENMPNHRGNAK